MTILLLAAGLVLLIGGADLLVRGASRLAGAVGMSPLVVGLTVVAFGTSAPELAVSAAAGLAGRGDLALGNVVGSNIFNVLFVLGASAMVAPLVVSRRLVRLDVPIMIGVSALAFALAADGAIGRLDGALLLAVLIVHTAWLILPRRRRARDAPESDAPESDGPESDAPESDAPESDAPGSDAVGDAAAAGLRRRGRALAIDGLAILGGLALLVLGSRWLVAAASAIAARLGVSELVIGLTVVAAGTSLPEGATSVIASLRGERDIAVGNVVGSNLFNLLGVLGVAGLVTAGGVAVPASALRFDLPVMLAVAVACLPIFFTGHRIDRWEGALFFGYYVAYTLVLILRASGSPALATLGVALLGFVLPLTAITLAISVGRALVASRSA